MRKGTGTLTNKSMFRFVSAVCPDDSTACAIEFRGKRFALGVKFHPELMRDGGFDKIFEAFVLACKGC